MIYNTGIECASREKIQKIQQERLISTVERCYENVPFYRKAFDEKGITPADIKTLDDVVKIPFTLKDDLRQNYPYNMFAVPMKQVIRLHASSGTTGLPTVVGYTKNDIEMWAELIARLAAMAGGGPDDIAQISFGYGLFTGAFGLHYGLEKLGATVIPISGGNTERQVNIMRDFGSTILVATPSYALYIAEVAERMGVTKDQLKLRIGMFGGEGHTVEMRAELQERLGILATENYGLSELVGPGVSGECREQNGMHINEDHFLLEVIDPDTEKPLPMGSKGELVITSISREAIPILRYRTKDITWLFDTPCECGRTSMRMGKIQGRTDDMLIIRGVNVFPSQIESVLLSMDEVGPHYEIIVSKENYLDKIEILVEVSDVKLLESFRDLEALAEKVRAKLKAVLQIDAKVSLVEPFTLKRFEGKAKRVQDLR